MKSIVVDSVTVCDEIINAIDSVPINVTKIISTNMTNTLSTNVTSTVSTNSDDKTVKYEMNYYILNKLLLVIIILFIITITCYHYIKHRSKQKRIGALTIQKWRKMNLQSLY